MKSKLKQNFWALLLLILFLLYIYLMIANAWDRTNNRATDFERLMHIKDILLFRSYTP
mgnify:CR=1 FL=1